uniref:myotubularin-related protein 13-like n=1 Tax=Myxine glutinosa TaxID=7769 RepID=UPI00358F28FA
MARLVDYFAVVGFEHRRDGTDGGGQGNVLQRFPEEDWPNAPFPQGLELFCQPGGWRVLVERTSPSFFVAVLTDINSESHYCASLTFLEPATDPQDAAGMEEHSEETSCERYPDLILPAQTFAPKSLVLVSRFDFTEVFRNCLRLLYAAYVDRSRVSLETMIGKLLSAVIPVFGGVQKLSLGFEDRQFVQAPLCTSLPISGCSVALLFHQLGIRNVIMVVCAALTDQKILLHSSSYQRLSEACRAIMALLFPLKYSYPYIPILPSKLLEVLSTPTPFVIGINSMFGADLQELLDAIVVDLDGGTVSVPECVHLSMLPESIMKQTMSILSAVIHPDLDVADHAFPAKFTPSSLVVLDKEIRAVFLRVMAQLFEGYRSCLQVIRIHPQAIISFHKASFLGQRGLVDEEFVSKLLGGMAFGRLISERGFPWRSCDIFDEVVANDVERIHAEEGDKQKILRHVSDLAQPLYANENPSPQPPQQKIPQPTEGAHLRLHLPVFPYLKLEVIHDVLKQCTYPLPEMARVEKKAIVPPGRPLGSIQMSCCGNSSRRLEVVSSCISSIFENKMVEVKKSLPATLRAMQSPTARRLLTRKLAEYAHENRNVLEHQQFDYVVRLVNGALKDCSSSDENGVAAALLPLVTTFCRKLCLGVIQYLYTRVQEHPVWMNSFFWEYSFYDDVQQDIRALYLPNVDKEDREWLQDGKSPMLVAAEELQAETGEGVGVKQEQEEEGIVFSQAIQYANRMLCLLVPLDSSRRGALLRPSTGDAESGSNSVPTNSLAGSVTGSMDSESGFEEADGSDTAGSVTRFISRFVDKVCTESGVSPERIRSLHSMIPGNVTMHMENLEAVHRESKKLPPVQKLKLVLPSLLPNEQLFGAGLRAFLLPDGREEASNPDTGSPTLLPAEGALFLTTYRVVFLGTPCEPLAGEQMVKRSFPIGSLSKAKRISGQTSLEQLISEGVQLHSSTFQLLRLGFDADVAPEMVDAFIKQVQKLRCPGSPLGTFAYMQGSSVTQHLCTKTKDKPNQTFVSFSKNIVKNAKKAGLKSMGWRKTATQLGEAYPSRNSALCEEDRYSVISEDTESLSSAAGPGTISVSHLGVDHAAETLCLLDFHRLGLTVVGASPSRGTLHPFRISPVNELQAICQTYPHWLLVPSAVTDTVLQRLARCYRQNRLPTISWRHPSSGSLLLRSGGPLGKGMVGGLFKSHGAHPAGPASADSQPWLDHERFLHAVLFSTMGSSSPEKSPLACTHDMQLPARHREIAKQNRLSTMIKQSADGHTQANASSLVNAARWGSLRLSRRFIDSTSSIQTLSPRPPDSPGSASSMTMQSVRSAPMSPAISDCRVPVSPKTKDILLGSAGRRAWLYILGEKSQLKAARFEPFPHVEYQAVEFPDVPDLRASFRKLLRACVPPTSSTTGFLVAVEESGWLLQVQKLLKLSLNVAKLLDAGSSVIVGLEDGWDATTQVVCLAQLLSESYYRTLDGFRTLLTKEWFAFGHRFAYYSGLLSSQPRFSLTPIFLIFLDCVHQIQRQFPSAFEFNFYYLKFLAYHHVSNRFKTFQFDADLEHSEEGSLMDENLEVNGHQPATSIWDYIENLNKGIPVFYNLLYFPTKNEELLRLCTSLPALCIWDYYTSEALGDAFPYEPELWERPICAVEDALGSDRTLRTQRHSIWPCYSDCSRAQPDAITQLLEEIQKLESELGRTGKCWKDVWVKTMQEQTQVSPGNLSRTSIGPHTPSTSTGTFSQPAESGVGSSLVALNGSFADDVLTISSRNVPTKPGSMSSLDLYSTFPLVDSEQRSFEGCLYKRGALLKGWKARWFVLDKTKHQLRYYESKDDTNGKGEVDLSEVESVNLGVPVLGAPRNVDEKSLFELKTTKRIYNFYAPDAESAKQWVDQIQSCLVDA